MNIEKQIKNEKKRDKKKKYRDIDNRKNKKIKKEPM